MNYANGDEIARKVGDVKVVCCGITRLYTVIYAALIGQ